MNPRRLLQCLAMAVLLVSGTSAIELNSSEALKYYGQNTQDFRVSPQGNALIDDGTLNITNDGEAVANFSGTGIDLYKPLSVRSSGPLSVANGIDLTGTSSNTIESLSTFYLTTSSGSASDIVLDPTGQVGVDSNLETTGNISIGGNQLDLENGDIENVEDVQTGSITDSDGDSGIDLNSNQIYNLRDPDDPQDAATKSYTDSSDDTIADNQPLSDVLSRGNNAGGTPINFNNNEDIQSSGVDAITLDGNQNVGIPNGNLQLSNNNIDNVASVDGGGNSVQIFDNLSLNNNNLSQANGLNLNDPGPDGRVSFGDQAEIYSAPLDDSNSGGYLQLVNDGGIAFEPSSDGITAAQFTTNNNLDLNGNSLTGANINGDQINDNTVDNTEIQNEDSFSFDRLTIPDDNEPGGAELLTIGDDTYLTDLDDANTLGIQGVQDSSVASLKLGNGALISGRSNGDLDISGGAAGDGTQDGLSVDSSGNLYFSGSLNFPGDVNTVNAQELDGSFLPSQDAQFNIGSSSTRWNNGYFSGTVTAANFEDSGGTNLDDKYVNEAGDTMTDNLNLGGNDLTNIGDRGNGIRIGDPTGVNGITDSDFYGIKIKRDTDNAFFGLRNYGDDADDVVINNEQNSDDIRIQSDGQDRLTVRGSGGVDIPTGNLDVSGGTVDARGGGDILNDGFRLKSNGVLQSRRGDGNLYFDITSSGGTTRLRDSGNNDIVRANDNGNVEVPNGGVDIGSPSRTGGQLDVGGGANFNGDVDLNNGGGLDNVNDIEMDGTIFGAGVDFSLEEVGDIKGPNNGDTDLNIQTQGGGGHVVSIEDGSSSNADIAVFKEGSQSVEVPNGDLEVKGNQVYFGTKNNGYAIQAGSLNNPDLKFVDRGAGDSPALTLKDGGNVRAEQNLEVEGKITEIGGKGTNEIRDDGDLVVDSDDKIEFADNGNTYMEVGASASEGDTQIDTDGDVTTNGRLDANSEGGEISDDSGSSMDVQTDGDVVVTLG